MDRPPYLRIADDIRARITAGELRTGQAVPSARQITRDWGVALATATKVLATLRQEGLVTSVPGIGTVVAQERRPEPVRRTRRTHDGNLVRTAVRIADREGLAEVSMRRIATELSVATMSLYRQVSSKDELVLLMIDSVMAEVPDPEQTADLRADLMTIGRAQWQMFRAHPWLAPALSVARPQLVPTGMRHTDRILGRLRTAGLSLQDAMYVHLVLLSYVRGIATALEPEEQAVLDSGMSVDEYLAAHAETFDAIVADGMPHLAAVARQDFDFTLDLLFEFGLARLLDGLDAYIAERTGPSRGGRRPVA